MTRPVLDALIELRSTEHRFAFVWLPDIGRLHGLSSQALRGLVHDSLPPQRVLKKLKSKLDRLRNEAPDS